MKQSTVDQAFNEAFDQYGQESSGLTREAWRTRQVWWRLNNAAHELGEQFCIARTLFNKLKTVIPKDYGTNNQSNQGTRKS